jgi:hypothetical protein
MSMERDQTSRPNWLAPYAEKVSPSLVKARVGPVDGSVRFSATLATDGYVRTPRLTITSQTPAQARRMQFCGFEFTTLEGPSRPTPPRSGRGL